MPSPLTPEARERLADAARAATPGPWQFAENDMAHMEGDDFYIVACDDAREVEVALLPRDCGWPNNAAYIAAASPDVVLALLESEARLREALERQHDHWCDEWQDDKPGTAAYAYHEERVRELRAVLGMPPFPAKTHGGGLLHQERPA
jgi:hypothetical protein